jgi:hypothetical protein
MMGFRWILVIRRALLNDNLDIFDEQIYESEDDSAAADLAAAIRGAGTRQSRTRDLFFVVAAFLLPSMITGGSAAGADSSKN